VVIAGNGGQGKGVDNPFRMMIDLNRRLAAESRSSPQVA
jgi:hypothetical protein